LNSNIVLFIKRNLIITILVFILLLFSEFSIRRTSTYSLKAQKLKFGGQIETLILGGSHALYGINPSYLKSNSFNAAHVSQSLDLDFSIIDSYKFPKLKYILLPVSYPTLYYTIRDCNIGDEKKRQNKYNLYYSLKNQSNVSMFYWEIFNDGSSGLSKLKKIAQGVKNIIYIKTDMRGYNGFGSDFHTWSEIDTTMLKETASAAVKRHTLINVKNQHGECKMYLNKIVDYCNKNNVKLVLILTPTTPFYYSNLNKFQLEKTKSICANLSRNNPNVVYLDYLKNSTFNLWDFHDGDHLSSKGAEKLSLILRRKIERDFK
jgi:hypothetical protein